MKTVKEEAPSGYCPPEYYDFCKGNCHLSGIRECARRQFYRGIELANRWISVDEELPPVSNDDILIRGIDCNEYYCVDAGYMQTPGGSVDYIVSQSGELQEITHWRPVELK
jgi:hypothetical protein